jgi:energy-converting hydrogenase A subunit R
MPMIEIPEKAKLVHDFSEKNRETLRQLDEFFWEEILRMKSGRMLEEVNPVGGYEKANAVQDIVRKLDSGLHNVIYVGDSITDVSPFQLVKKNGGLTISFNGNYYAIREAEIAVLSDNTIITSILADVFNKYGREGIIKLINEWSRSTIEKYVDSALQKRVFELWNTSKLPQVELITDENRDRLAKESSAFRKTIRGESVGRLG